MPLYINFFQDQRIIERRYLLKEMTGFIHQSAKQNRKEIFLVQRSYFSEHADYVLQSFKDGYEIKYKVYINKHLHSMSLLQIGKL